jgi:hypothetical protein
VIGVEGWSAADTQFRARPGATCLEAAGIILFMDRLKNLVEESLADGRAGRRDYQQHFTVTKIVCTKGTLKLGPSAWPDTEIVALLGLPGRHATPTTLTVCDAGS